MKYIILEPGVAKQIAKQISPGQTSKFYVRSCYFSSREALFKFRADLMKGDRVSYVSVTARRHRKERLHMVIIKTSRRKIASFGRKGF